MQLRHIDQCGLMSGMSDSASFALRWLGTPLGHSRYLEMAVCIDVKSSGNSSLRSASNALYATRCSVEFTESY